MATPTQLNKAHVFGIPATFVLYAPNGSSAISGYTSPNISGANLTHHAQEDMIKSSTGEYTGIIMSGEYLECTFDLVPEGTTSQALAALSAPLPALGSSVAITGLPYIPSGGTTDGSAGGFCDGTWGAFNSGGSGVTLNRWIYSGGGSWKLNNAGHATMTLPLKRFTSTAGITGLSAAIVG